jgi:hypothetical protein
MVHLLISCVMAVAGAMGATRDDAAARPDGDARAQVRAAWKAMAPEERSEVEKSWQRWRALPSEERERYQQRFERLVDLRRREREVAGADVPPRELSRRALARLREKYDALPKELHERLGAELAALPPHLRERRLKQSIHAYLDFALRERVSAMAQRGELPADAVQRFDELAKDKAGDRIAALRQLVVDHPDAFRLSPETAERMRRIDDPTRGLRLIDAARRHRGERPPRSPRLPKPPRDWPPPPPREEGAREEGKRERSRRDA